MSVSNPPAASVPGHHERRWQTLRRRLTGIRVRIVAGYIILIAVTLLGSILVIRQLLFDRLDQEIDDQLTQEINELRVFAEEGINPATGERFGGDVDSMLKTFLQRNVPGDHEEFYTFLDGLPGQRSFEAPETLLHDESLVDEWSSAERPHRRTHQTERGEVRSLVVPVEGRDGTTAGTFVVAYFPTSERDEIVDILRTITFAAVVAMLFSALVAWSLVGRIIRPVRQLTTAARQISDSNLSARIPVEGHDELAELGTTFNSMVERLEQSFEYQRRFLDDVAHELRTPITIARGHIDVFDETADDRDETLAVVSDELDRMSRYVSELLMLAKAGHPDFLRLGPVDLGELATNIHQRVVALGDRDWVIDAAPSEDSITVVVADEERLLQTAVNLATNAVQHTNDGDEIGVGIRVNGASYELWVRDTGPGIDPEVLDTLFHRYARGANSRVSQPEGMGIGLSIVDAIARAHGGSVSAVSPPGSGATFMVTCPTDPETPGDSVDDERR